MTKKTAIEGTRTKITPSMAMKWLETMTVNRSVRQYTINQYARDIVNGEWLENGETIKFNKRGELIDGQHRLWAVIEAGKPIYSLVARNIDPEAMLTVDSGMNRRFHDHLHIVHGIPNVHAIATAVRMQWYWEKSKWPIGRGRSHGRSVKMKPSHCELEACYERHPQLAGCVDKARLKPQIISRAILGWFLYQAIQVNVSAAEQFRTDLQDGAGLSKDDPVNKLRARMLINHGAREKLEPEVTVGFLFKCWHTRRKKKRMQVLRWNSTEGYPPLT
jgi:hypothetical protein